MKNIAPGGFALLALALTPRAAADIPGITPFTGSWHAHASGLTINSDASGRLTYADISACPGACSGRDDYADAPLATIDFTLTSVSGDTATGTVNVASNPSNDTVGEPVTIKLITGIGDPFTGPPASVSRSNGVALEVRIGKMRDWNYCNDTTHNYCGG
ncbi:hypothetical protein GCM10009641_83690 [Mycobacterium cookii]|uniref:Lipoprotein n=1 Tax=Mycobacterium cookii TaxID=1775 RepID=A0A7I7KRN4_9MYCO|nr:hypothetical protein [Mycobacterium cookii]MCV7331775.1 hypothetical protein [Mycobacterium cookii]BBX44379.1 hypothetical protein MCOO_03940 [Mycobacterium cookii]